MASKTLFAATLLLVPLAAWADQVATIGDLDRVQAQIVVAEAQLQLAEARRKLAETQGRGVEETKEDSAPVVTGVYGAASAPYARFAYADGSQHSARAGDVLPGGYKVVMVSVERVVISRHGRRLEARFARSAPAAAPQPPASPAAGADIVVSPPMPGPPISSGIR